MVAPAIPRGGGGGGGAEGCVLLLQMTGALQCYVSPPFSGRVLGLHCNIVTSPVNHEC